MQIILSIKAIHSIRIIRSHQLTANSKQLLLTFRKRPLQHFLPAWFFTIHKDSGSINFPREPGGKNKAANEEGHG